MNYNPETKEIKDVCILDEQSRFWNAPNLSELVNTIQEQLSSKAEQKNGMGIFGYSSDCVVDLDRVAFTYKNPRVIENKIYIDVEISDTPMGKIVKCLFDDVAGTTISDIYRFTLTGIGIVNYDRSVQDYQLSCVNLISRVDN